jgi:hypothetical protein
VAIGQFGGGGRVAVIALVLAAGSILSVLSATNHLRMLHSVRIGLRCVMVGASGVGLGYWRMDYLTWRETFSSPWVALIFSLAGGASVTYLVSSAVSISLRWGLRRQARPSSRAELESLPLRSRWAVSLVTVAGIVTASAWLLPIEAVHRGFDGFIWTGLFLSSLIASVAAISAVAVVSGITEKSALWLAGGQYLAVASGAVTLALFAVFHFWLGGEIIAPMTDMLRALFGNATLALLGLTSMFVVGLALEFPDRFVQRSRLGQSAENSPDPVGWLADKEFAEDENL